MPVPTDERDTEALSLLPPVSGARCDQRGNHRTGAALVQTDLQVGDGWAPLLLLSGPVTRALWRSAREGGVVPAHTRLSQLDATFCPSCFYSLSVYASPMFPSFFL